MDNVLKCAPYCLTGTPPVPTLSLGFLLSFILTLRPQTVLISTVECDVMSCVMSLTTEEEEEEDAAIQTLLILKGAPSAVTPLRLRAGAPAAELGRGGHFTSSLAPLLLTSSYHILRRGATPPHPPVIEC